MRVFEIDSDGFDAFPNNNLISEGGMSKVVSTLDSKEFGIITAYRASATKTENIQRNRKLRGDLNSARMGGYPLVGHWEECQATDDEGNPLPYDQCPADAKVDSIERSYLVPKPKEMPAEEFREFLLKLSAKYDQDGIVYADGKEIHVLFTGGGSISFGGVSYGSVGQAYSQHTRNKDVPFIFEGVEVPGSISGRGWFQHCGVKYPLLENETTKTWKDII